MTACPSGVEYGDLITAFRAHAEQRRRAARRARATRALVARTLPYPRRFRAAATARPRWRRRSAAAAADARPAARAACRSAQPLPAVFPAEGARRARVALLAGCAQQVLEPEIGWATLRVLARNGVETVVPRGQGCCGALAMHGGRADQARQLARRNLRAFPADVDAVIANAAGCGSGMREYGLLFAGEPDEERARELAGARGRRQRLPRRARARARRRPREPLRVAYHDACHLAHAQKVREAPQRLLRAAGHEVVVPDEWELCCGSAGTYNVEQPETAAELGRRKAANLRATGADVVAAGNIGCLTQIRQYLDLPVRHTIQILDRGVDAR